LFVFSNNWLLLFGGILGLHSEAKEKEVSEVETPENTEWSFQKKDFIPTNADQKKSLKSAEKTEEANKKSDKDEKLVNEVGTEKKEANSPNGNLIVSPPARKAMGTANPTQLKSDGPQLSPSEKIAEITDIAEKINHF
jgi:hypothetical protein